MGLIVVAVALTVAWGILGAPEAAGPRAVAPARVLAYFFGSLLFLLLIGGLVLIVLLLLREVRLNERQSNFVSAVTHELKTPVASLKLYLDTLEYRDVPPDRRAEFYRTMRQDIERLNATINNVLNAAMYTDRPVADPRPLDLARLVRRAAELTLTRNQLAKSAIRYAGPQSLRVAGDPQALETALLNLLDNAVKYSQERVEIEIEAWGDADGQAHVRVRDHGIGISRTHLPFIFTRFYRIGAEVRRSRTGTGLGLFIVARSSRGTGARSRSRARDRTSARPLRHAARPVEPETEPDAQPEAARAWDPAGRGRGAPGGRDPLQPGAEGYEVETIADGLRALERLVPEPTPPRPADRPRGARRDAARAGRLRDRRSDARAGNYTAVLMLTAKGLPEDVVEGLEAGADDYLPKPFDLPVLLARVKGLIRRREWARGAAGDLVKLGDAEVDFASFELRKGDAVVAAHAARGDAAQAAGREARPGRSRRPRSSRRSGT